MQPSPPRRNSVSASGLLIVLSLGVSASLRGQTWEYSAYLDLDDDVTTGCSVVTVEGPFDGVEQLLQTTVTGDQVTAVSTAGCTDPATDTFGPPVAVTSPFAPPWPVGLGNGTGGSDVIETYAPIVPSGVIRLGFASDDGLGNGDALLSVDGMPDGDPILLGSGVSPLEIPTLGTWILLLLTVALAVLALWFLRHEPRAAISLLAVAFLAVSVATLWAAVGLDGLIDDWAGFPALALDSAVDAPSSVNILAAFGRIEPGSVCLRFDASRIVPPDARDDLFSIDEDTVLSGGNVLADNGNGADTDPLGGVLTVDTAPVSGPGNGGLTLGADGSFTYTPNADFAGTDTFVYEVSNTVGGVSTATVTITVDPVDDPPAAVDDAATVAEGAPATAIDVLANDTDVDGGPISISATSDPPGGTVVTTGGGSGLTYQPDPNFCNDGAPTDDFTYTLAPGGSTATVRVTVPCVDDPPTAVDDAATVTEDAPATAIDVLANDTDPDGGPISIAATSDPPGGTVVTTGGGSGLTYQPDPNFCNDGAPTDDFTYTLAPGGSTATVRVTVTCGDDPPTAVDDAATVAEDDPATAIDVLANDTDPDGGPISISTTSDPPGGTVVTTGGGAGLTYQPDPNFCNDGAPTDDFTYTLAPGGSTATVRVTVTCVNDPPMAVADTFDTIGNTELRVDLPAAATPTVTANTTSTLGLLDNDGDPVEMSPVSIAGIVGCADATAPFGDGPACSTANGGTVVVQANGRFSFLPLPGDPAPSDSFQYQLSDGTDVATGTVTLVLIQRVWYVKNDSAAGGLGRSSDPFDTLVEAQTASVAGDTIFVFEGDGTTAGQDGGITLQAAQRLHGEGIGLSFPVSLNGAPAPTGLVPAGGKPLLDNGSGPGVTVSDVDAVEVRGLSIDGADAAVEVTVGDGSSNTVLVSDNTLTGEATAFTASTTNGTLDLSFTSNVGIASGSGNGIVLDGSAGGTLNVVEFADLVVDGTNAGAGIFADTVVFDTAPADGDFTGDTVAAGAVAVGSLADPVDGPGVVLLSVSGDLSFADLDVFATGAGLAVSGTGVFNAGAGTGFRIATPAGSTIAATGGPAVDLDPLTASLTFDSIASTNSPTTGVSLVEIDGSFSAGGASAISGAQGTAFHVDNGTATVAYAGTLDNTTNRSVVVTNRPAPAGAITFSGSIGSAGPNTGSGILVDTNAGGTVTFSGPVDLSTAANGAVTLTANAGATVQFIGNLAINTTTGTGFSATGGGTVGLSGTNSITSAGAPALLLDGITIGGGATFASLSSTNAGAANDGVRIVNVGGGPLSVSGTTTVQPGAGSFSDGIDINGSGAAFTFASVDIDNATGAGIRLSNNGGTVTVSGGDVTGSAGAALDVDLGAQNVVYNGTINNSAGRAVEVTNRTGGTVTFGGAVVDSGPTNSGILLDNNDGATVVFTSTVDVTGTSGAGVTFSNTGGGGSASFADLDVDNSTTSQIGLFATANTGGTLDVTTGTVNGGQATAVDIDNTALGVTLRSVSSSGGGAVGVDLFTTTGSFAVVGDGTGLRNGSGGTISNKTGRGIRLNRVTDITLDSMNITNTGDDGIFGGDEVVPGDGADFVNGLTMRGTVLSNNGNAANEHGMELRDLIGAVLLDNVRVTGSGEHGVVHFNDSGTITSLTVQNSEIDNISSGVGYNFELRSGPGAPSLTVASISDNNVHDNFATGLFFLNNGGGTMGAGGPNQLVIQNNTLSDNNIAIDVSMGAQSNTTNFVIQNHTTILRNTSHAINVASADTAGDTSANTINGTLSGNVIGDGTAGSGSTVGTGIRVNLSDPIDAAIRIDNNQIRNVKGRGIEAVGRLGGGGGDAAFTITNNTIVKDKGTPLMGDTFAGVFMSADGNGVCANVRGNSVDGDICENFGAPGFVFLGCDFLVQEVAGSVFQLESGATDCAGAACVDAKAHILATNTAVNGNVEEIDGAGTIVSGAIALVAPGTCDTP